AAKRTISTGALPLRPRDLTQLRQNGLLTGRLAPPLPFRPLSRRSGRIPALPYPPLSYLQSGATATSPSRIFHPTAITPLTSCRSSGVQFSTRPSHFIPARIEGCSAPLLGEACVGGKNDGGNSRLT